ncbi:MAG: Chromosomal replication initiator protein DnaA [Calditrichaeota bacterium]|nr:Chromosomal replication initiator protein DnaA [Calditrichota bacterium]
MTLPARRILTKSVPAEADDDAVAAWEPVLSALRQSLPEQAFHTWFETLRPLSLDDNVLTVEVPSRFYYEWIEGHYANLLDSVVSDQLGEACNLQYALANGSRPEAEPPPVTVTDRKPIARAPRSLAEDGLNERYTFTSFIEGPPNRFARAASLAVSDAPGKTSYNPLLIYGGVGLGKTHLLQAIGNEVSRRDPDLRVRYISSEQFLNEFVEAVKANRGDRFSARYRSVDLLLMDDVQLLVGRDRTLMEFFHIFNALYQAGRQIVLSSDKPPRELNGLDERLVSRFGWGLVCDIGPPDFDTRVAIVEMLCEQEAVSLYGDVIEYIAERFTNNVREMQGALIRLVAHASLNGSDITLELAKNALRDLVSVREQRVDVETVQRIVADHYNIAPDMLIAKLRTQPIAHARMIAMALSLRLCHLSLKQVGARFGGRDHTTVLHARERVERWREESERFAAEIAALVRRITTETG